MVQETLEQYLQRLKDRRTEDDYKYTDEDFEKYKQYISDCCKSGMSVYKCLEFMYFAEKDMDDQLFNRVLKQETLEEVAEKEFPLIDTEWCRTGACEEENLHLLGHRKSFIKGAKWQQERSYSEEEVLQLVSDWTDYRMSEDSKSKVTFKKWFEQFKKK
jgi:hypothetical protein